LVEDHSLKIFASPNFRIAPDDRVATELEAQLCPELLSEVINSARVASDWPVVEVAITDKDIVGEGHASCLNLRDE